MIRRRQRSQRRRETESQRGANENLPCDHDLSPVVIGGAIAAHNIKTDRPRIFSLFRQTYFLSSGSQSFPGSKNTRSRTKIAP
jgi:hypothetical protein